MTADPAEQLKALDATIGSIEKVLDVGALRRDLAELEEMAGAPDLWDDQERAQALMSRMATVKSDLERVEGVRRRHDDLVVLLELAELEDDEGTRTEVDDELATLGRDVEALEVRTLLSGEYDAREALVQISPGAGGVDSQDWAEMLLRMYTRWAERRGYPVEVYETQYAEEAGIKSVTFAVKAPYAYGTLAGEHGVHRLVRISPFDNQARRQTSFAAVDVTPVIETTEAMEIPENEIRVDVYRSSGPGGQSVNTTDSAVRLTHVPTGVVVSCQNEKSQLQNKASAMRILTSRLLERRRQEEQAKMDSIRGSKSENAFGSQIRNYVLHPYQLVKDVRTNVETGNTGSVLDGEIDEFVEAGIRWRRAQADVPAEA